MINNKRFAINSCISGTRKESRDCPCDGVFGYDGERYQKIIQRFKTMERSP
jgi:hypothetical protein